MNQEEVIASANGYFTEQDANYYFRRVKWLGYRCEMCISTKLKNKTTENLIVFILGSDNLCTL